MRNIGFKLGTLIALMSLTSLLSSFGKSKSSEAESIKLSLKKFRKEQRKQI